MQGDQLLSKCYHGWSWHLELNELITEGVKLEMYSQVLPGGVAL